MRTDNLAIAFIDIAGFTPRTSAQSREENHRMLQRFDAVVRPLVRGFGGRVIKTLGDAFLLTFRSPTDAVHCAMAIHDGLAESATSVPDSQRFKVRAAINVGEVRLEGGDVYGEAVNIAARIESKADAGEIYFSEAVYLAMTRSEVPSEEVGYFDLKGIPEQVRLYRVPRVEEVGSYRVAGSGDVAASQAEHPLEPIGLPFGGLALARVRSRGRVLGGTAAGAGWQARLAQLYGSARELSLRGWDEFRGRWQRSSRFRAVSLAVLAVVLAATMYWAWPKHHPKPLTGWQKLQRRLGIR